MASQSLLDPLQKKPSLAFIVFPDSGLDAINEIEFFLLL